MRKEKKKNGWLKGGSYVTRMDVKKYTIRHDKNYKNESKDAIFPFIQCNYTWIKINML